MEKLFDDYKKANRWYLSEVVIIVLSFFWILYGIPIIIAIGIAAYKVVNRKKIALDFENLSLEQEEAQLRYKKLENDLEATKMQLENLNGLELIDIQKKIDLLNADHDNKRKEIEIDTKKLIENLKLKETEANSKLIEISKTIVNKELEIKSLNESIDKLKLDIRDLEDMSQLEEFGVHKPKYACMNSDEYSTLIKDIRVKQKTLIKDKIALNYFKEWTLDGSRSKGEAMNNDNMKMVLRAFNNECDVLISKVKFNNIETIRQKIRKAAEQIDRLNKRVRISINQKYIDLKISELDLVFEYSVKKQEEKEAMREARAEAREAEKLQKEIQEARSKLLKEQQHYGNELRNLSNKLANATDLNKITELNLKITEINEHLQDINKGMQEIDYREANQRAGYVYVISNIGSFGENIYKIGMTRRLEPQDRVDELGGASVPFKFDIHAMIFSDDAPTLENALHKAFDNNKINMINGRKEFFNVKLEEIEREVRKNHTKLIEFVDVPDAEQYRESQVIKKQINVTA